MIKGSQRVRTDRATPITNANRPKWIKPGTVGPAVKDTLIKIGDDGEVHIKEPQVMEEDCKNEAATKEAFTQDGFFRTGDIGEIDRDGYLQITGRIKDITVTSGGTGGDPSFGRVGGLGLDEP